MHGLFLNDVWMMCDHWVRERERERREMERESLMTMHKALGGVKHNR